MTIDQTVDARKATIKGAKALDLLKGVDHLYATRGRKVIHLDLTTRPPRAEIGALLIGPTGNLRAPTVRTGRTLLVGFDEETYRRFAR